MHLRRQWHKKYGKFRHNCSGCQRKFATLSALRRLGHHCDAGIPAGQASGTDSSRSNTSKVCRRKFITSSALLRHGPQCTPALPARETASASNSRLKSTSHKGKWYTCVVANCSYKTRFRESFRCHREYHQKYGILPHSCTVCKRKFPTAAALLIHAHRCPATTRIPSNQTSGTSSRSSNTPESSQVQYQRAGRWYTCAVADCNFSTLYGGNMQRHQRHHMKHGNFAHTCEDCHRKFATASALLRRARMCSKTPANTVVSPAPAAMRALNKSKAFTCGQDSCTFRANTFRNLRIHQGMAHGTSGRGSPTSNPQSCHEPQTTTVV